MVCPNSLKKKLENTCTVVAASSKLPRSEGYRAGPCISENCAAGSALPLPVQRTKSKQQSVSNLLIAKWLTKLKREPPESLLRVSKVLLLEQRSSAELFHRRWPLDK